MAAWSGGADKEAEQGQGCTQAGRGGDAIETRAPGWVEWRDRIRGRGRTGKTLAASGATAAMPWNLLVPRPSLARCVHQCRPTPPVQVECRDRLDGAAAAVLAPPESRRHLEAARVGRHGGRLRTWGQGRRRLAGEGTGGGGVRSKTAAAWRRSPSPSPPRTQRRSLAAVSVARPLILRAPRGEAWTEQQAIVSAVGLNARQLHSPSLLRPCRGYVAGELGLRIGFWQLARSANSSWSLRHETTRPCSAPRPRGGRIGGFAQRPSEKGGRRIQRSDSAVWFERRDSSLSRLDRRGSSETFDWW